jgi:tetratricopeptide (TPR) repeat protein
MRRSNAVALPVLRHHQSSRIQIPRMRRHSPSRGTILVALCCLSAIAALLCFTPDAQHRVQAAAVPPATVAPLDHPDAVCANCHKAIYEKYEQTAMARGSGIATAGLIPGGFHHKASDIDYSVFLRDGAAWMNYSRDAKSSQGALAGERQLLYYIGSGHRGRTYLFEQNGQWFELPINHYTRKDSWAMAPAFDDASSMPAPLPVDPNCLHCHATDVQANLPEARSRFVTVPFRQGGIGCSSCHGDPAQHLAAKGRGPIVNPAKLSVSRRDSSCIQCHLEGSAVVYRPGKSLAQFKAGDDLADFAVYFVRTHEAGDGRRATSQYEALLRSACKRASGDKLTCTTCHDPHFDPSPAERVKYFRSRCLACHTSPAMATHHPEQQDCAKCHMISRNTTDISHEQVTDHDIEARPSTGASAHFIEASSDELVPVGGVPAGEREYGLAYMQEALQGDRHAAELSIKLLAKAAANGASDPELNTRLGYLQQINNEPDKARASYMAALSANPYEPSALANLAVLDAGSGQVPEAIHLLERLVTSDPTQTSAGLNLVYIDCKLGHTAQALAVLRQLESANPDNPQLRTYQRTGNYGSQHCSLSAAP